MPAALYLRMVLLTFVVVGLLAGGLIYFVDPYAQHDTTLIGGFNEIKPRSRTHLRAGKEMRLLRAKPTTVILGNSRADIGFDPKSAKWPAQMQPVFNFAIPGEPMSGTLDRYRFSVRGHAPKFILLPLDYMDFLSEKAGPKEFPIIPDAAKLSIKETLLKTAERYFSVTAFSDSIRTIMGQGSPYPTDMTIQGFNPFKEFVPVIKLEGHYLVARAKLKKNRAGFERQARGFKLADGREAAPLRQLRALLQDARARGITLIVLFYPYHAEYLDLLAATGRWRSFEDWKRTIVAVLAEEEFNAQGTGPLVWDFANYDQVTMEPIPRPGDKAAEMRYFWEPSHFKAALGDLILERIFTGKPAGYGLPLTRQNIEAALVGIQRRQKTYAGRFFENLR